VEPLILLLAGVAVLLFTASAIAIGRSRRKRSAPTAEQPFFDRDPDEVTIPPPTPPFFVAEDAPAANGERRRPVTVSTGATVDPASSPSSTPPTTVAQPLAGRGTRPSSPPTSDRTSRDIRFWRLFDPSADMDEDSGPICFAVDGVTAGGVLDLVRMDFENRGFIVRNEGPDRLRAHQGPVVLHATVRSVHTGLTMDRGAYRGTPQPFVVVEIEVPPAQPPLPTSPVVRFS